MESINKHFPSKNDPFTDTDGLLEDSFMVYITGGKFSEHTEKKLEQIKKLAEDNKDLQKLLPFVFKMGYGACVWDYEIGLEK